MSDRFETMQPEPLERYAPTSIDLEARIIGSLSDEEDIEEPYIRILDGRFRKRMVAMWPNGTERLPARITVRCRRGGQPYSFDTSKLVNCYLDSLSSETQSRHSLDVQNYHDESVIDARISLIVPEKHRQEFNGKLIEQVHGIAAGAVPSRYPGSRGW